MRVLLLKDKIIDGSYYPVGIVVVVPENVAQELIDAGEAAAVETKTGADEPVENSPKKKKTEK